MKKVVLLTIIAILAVSMAFATEGRIEALGKSDRFILDDMGVFTNPALTIVYPNLLVGSLGKYSRVNYWDASLEDQWFGGWASLPVGKNKLTVGASLNRKNDLEDLLNSKGQLNLIRDLVAAYGNAGDQHVYLVADSNFTTTSFGRLVVDTLSAAQVTAAASDPTSKWYQSGGSGWVYIQDSLSHDTVSFSVPKPVGQTEVMLSYAMDKMAIGAKLYVSRQESIVADVKEKASGVMSGNVGTVFKLNDKDLLDISLGFARITYFDKGAISDAQTSQMSLLASARAFLTVASLGGQVVPSIKYSNIAIAYDTTFYVSPGIGYTRGIEGGSFWAGVDFGYTKHRDQEPGIDDTTITKATTFAFGIEKQVAWPWFTLRVGGKKVISNVESRPGSSTQDITSRDVTNSDNSGGLDDVIGAGVGLNVGENLRFDLTANERLPFSNIFKGEESNIATKITASYAF